MSHFDENLSGIGVNIERSLAESHSDGLQSSEN